MHYALLDLDADWADPDRRYPVDLLSLRLTADREQVTLDMAQERLLKIKGIDVSKMSERSDRMRRGELDNDRTGVPGTMGPEAPGMAATSARLSQLDTNDDWLSREEARQAGEVDGDWSALDRDGNDRISRQEFAAEHRDRMNR